MPFGIFELGDQSLGDTGCVYGDPAQPCKTYPVWCIRSRNVGGDLPAAVAAVFSANTTGWEDQPNATLPHTKQGLCA